MNSDRKTAIIVGALLIACTASTIISMTLLGSILDEPDYLTKLSGKENLVVIVAIIELIWAATAMGIAIWMYPILKKYNETLALASVSFRIVEGLLGFVATLCLLSLLTLGQELVTVGATAASSFQATGSLLISVRYWTHNGILLIAFSLGVLFYYCVFYQSKLIPRWLSSWGIFGAVLTLAVTLFSLFNPSFVLSWIHTLFNAPIAVQEMVFAVWLIIKGFSSQDSI